MVLAGQYEDTFIREKALEVPESGKRATRVRAAGRRASIRVGSSTQDYIDIEQLVAKYSFSIDECSNAGEDYANLYTPDGEFAVSNQWGGGGKRTFVTTGHEALVRVAGGREGGKCVDPKTSPAYGISHVS